MKRYGEKTLREALENGAVLSIYDCPARGPILRVKKDNENLGWITFDLYLKIRLDLEVVKKGEYIKEYTLKSIVYADLRIGALTETTETETTETAQQEESGGIKWETVDGLAIPCNLDSVAPGEILQEVERLKEKAAPMEKEMEADNVPLHEWQELRKETAAIWEKIGVLQYIHYIPGAHQFQVERRFYNTESGDVLTLEDLLLCWSQHKSLREAWPRFGWYVAACQTYQGGTLEEIR